MRLAFVTLALLGVLLNVVEWTRRRLASRRAARSPGRPRGLLRGLPARETAAVLQAVADGRTSGVRGVYRVADPIALRAHGVEVAEVGAGGLCVLGFQGPGLVVEVVGGLVELLEAPDGTVIVAVQHEDPDVPWRIDPDPVWWVARGGLALGPGGGS